MNKIFLIIGMLTMVLATPNGAQAYDCEALEQSLRKAQERYISASGDYIDVAEDNALDNRRLNNLVDMILSGGTRPEYWEDRLEHMAEQYMNAVEDMLDSECSIEGALDAN